MTNESDPSQDRLPACFELIVLLVKPSDVEHSASHRGFLATSKVHKTSAWAKSKAFTGFVGPVTRARVNELWGGDDIDQPPNPSQRVSQLS